MLERLWKKIVDSERVSLWTLPAMVLRLISFGYRIGFLFRKAFVGQQVALPVPVLSVGNLTVGGSGKTPMVEFLARDLSRDGFTVGIVSSGYGRLDPVSFVRPGYKVSKMDIAQTGDEVMLLANSLPDAVFAVDASKSEAARRLADEKDVDVIIVDDGFQHFRLKRDIDLVTYDAAVKRHHLKLFPRGTLREPLKSLDRADILVLTRSKFARDIQRLTERLQSFSPGASVYCARFDADELIGRDQAHSVKYLEDKSVLVFAGIGNFRAFRKQVSALAADVDCALEFSDHQVYDRSLLEDIKSKADEAESDVIVTTFKDWVKLGNFDFGREIYYLNQRIDLDPGEEKLIAQIEHKLGLKKRDD